MAILFAVLALLQHDSDWQGTSWPRPICLGLVTLQLSNFLAQFCVAFPAPENGWLFINNIRYTYVYIYIYICTLHTACYTHGAV